MSGIVGIVNLDGAPVDPRLLQRMTDSLAFRGPDAQATWLGGHVGFGHTLLKTTFEAEREHQPFTLDGKVWIVADARIDAQAELIEKLRQRGDTSPADARSALGAVEHLPKLMAANDGHATAPVTDVELILRAYHTWGEDCVEHLLGDFAFGIWDGPRQRLFCARDQMGIKPFYYAHLGPVVIFSNTLDCVRLHPAVSDRLNDLAIADFLILEMNQDPATTSFADIQRLAPAHRATWSSAGLRLSRYWTLPIDEPLFYRRAEDYVDRFKELLRQAVTDRLRTRRVGVLMSGGLDSPTLAATTRDLLRERYGAAELKAFTRVASHGPNEHYYAESVANHLGISIQFQHLENELVDVNWERHRIHTPEPVRSPRMVPLARKHWGEIGDYSRVAFYGEGPDNALRFEWRPYFRYLLRKRQYGALLTAIFSVAAHGPLPFWGRVTRRIKEFGYRRVWEHECCLNPDLESYLKYRSRWERSLRLTSGHPVRPQGYASMLIPLWQSIFESMDAGWTTAPVELRHPYVDLRMVRYLLAVPALPWCRSKHLLRRAMRGVLPRTCLRRPKTGMPIALGLKSLARHGTFPLVPTPELWHYVSESYIIRAASENVVALGHDLGVQGLNYWLQNSRKSLKISQSENLDHEPFTESGNNSFAEKSVRKALPPDLR